ncbi:MAG: VWA domain-containing protein [Ignavibacteria bacterium]|jgi:Ca-activated chloride channel family protein|nr:VWA domain-containing protein [Ignavibacteria bacterium]MCU7503641.1 VWA domain-containing protein [Ignavibacteria bacterium]MCU7517876.1 VWA domain-containing protein [Ignavibacteria bacterium]
MFRFAHTEYLYALYIVPVIVALFYLVFRNQKKLLAKFSDAKLLRVLVPERSVLKYFLKSGIMTLVLILLILALANPQVGTRYENVKQTGIDVFILLDVSLSMNAEDIKPNRLEMAKHSISSLIDRLRGDRIGLVIFSGDAYIQFPLTTDYAAAKLILNAVNTGSVPQPGTAIASAIKLAVKSFKGGEKIQKSIIIITDGEDHEGDVVDAARDAADKNIGIYTIGLGSTAGVPIPQYNAQGAQTGYKLDRDGNVVVTKLDESILQQIAQEGKGRYYHGSSSGNELDMIYSDLSKLEKTEFGTTRVTDYEDRYYYLLAVAIVLLIAEFFISEKKNALLSKLNRKLGIE